MGFRRMRRFKQELGRDDCMEVIGRGTSGVLSVLGDGGYPYGVPIGYIFIPGSEPEAGDDGASPYDEYGVAYPGDKFYFHAAKTGHKIDAIKSCDKASFAIIDRDDVVADEFTTYFKSLIAFGKIKMIDDEQAMRRLVEILARRYSPDESDESVHHEIDREFAALAMIELEVEHMTGKEAIELVRKREEFSK